MIRKLLTLAGVPLLAVMACTTETDQATAVSDPAVTEVQTVSQRSMLTETVVNTPSPQPTATAEAPSNADAIRQFSRELDSLEERRERMLASIANRLGTGMSYGFVASKAGPLFGDAFMTGRTGETAHGASLPELLSDLALLESPPELRDIKELLRTAYLTEVQAAQGSVGERWPKVHPTVNYENLHEFKIGDDPGMVHPLWATAQRLRSKAYERWAQILREHGLNPCDDAGVCVSE